MLLKAGRTVKYERLLMNLRSLIFKVNCGECLTRPNFSLNIENSIGMVVSVMIWHALFAFIINIHDL